MTESERLLNHILAQVKLVHDKLDIIDKQTTINEQSAIHLKESVVNEKKETKDKFTIVHESIRRRDISLRWIASTILIPICTTIYAIFFKSPPG